MCLLARGEKIDSRLIAIVACYVITPLLLAVAGLMTKLGAPYFASLTIEDGIAFHHYKFVNNRSCEKCFAAFLRNNWFGAAVFAGLVVGHWVR
jgi:4-hydroxybenzoate polyprenyltransferase